VLFSPSPAGGRGVGERGNNHFLKKVFFERKPMKIIQTANAPAAIGPYSQAMQVGDLLFTSGQIPLRADGTLNDGDITAQTTQVFANLTAVIEAAGGSLNQVVKTTVFMKNLDDFAAMNKVYGDTFGSHTPARSTVQVAKLPRDVLVEIEAIVAL
jgi:2-iminobutanoate/2-iminopropanoate deaminase